MDMKRVLFAACLGLTLAAAVPAAADEAEGDRLFARGAYLSAGFAYDEATVDDPNNVPLLIKTCRAFAIDGTQLDRAKSACQRAFQRDVWNPSLRNVRGLLYYRQGRYQDALNDYDVSLKGRPNHAGTLYMRGMTYKKLGKDARGQIDIDAAKQIDFTIDRQLAAYGIR